jgi:hypothetical protein
MTYVAYVSVNANSRPRGRTGKPLKELGFDLAADESARRRR